MQVNLRKSTVRGKGTCANFPPWRQCQSQCVASEPDALRSLSLSPSPQPVCDRYEMIKKEKRAEGKKKAEYGVKGMKRRAKR